MCSYHLVELVDHGIELVGEHHDVLALDGRHELVGEVLCNLVGDVVGGIFYLVELAQHLEGLARGKRAVLLLLVVMGFEELRELLRVFDRVRADPYECLEIIVLVLTCHVLHLSW